MSQADRSSTRWIVRESVADVLGELPSRSSAPPARAGPGRIAGVPMGRRPEVRPQPRRQRSISASACATSHGTVAVISAP